MLWRPVRVAAAGGGSHNAVSPDETKGKKIAPEGHLESPLSGRYAPESCIGVLSDPCMETEEARPPTNDGLLWAREEVWDARLNASYRERMAPQTGPAPMPRTTRWRQKQLRKIQAALIPGGTRMRGTLFGGDTDPWSLAKVDSGLLRYGATARQALWMGGLLTWFRVTWPSARIFTQLSY